MKTETQQRIEREAIYKASKWSISRMNTEDSDQTSFHFGYIAGATAECERVENLERERDEYREIIEKAVEGNTFYLLERSDENDSDVYWRPIIRAMNELLSKYKTPTK